MSSVDMWSTGCIFAELFLLSVIGLPAQEDWPTESPTPYPANWKSGNTLNQLLPNLHQEERDLLLQFLAFNPSKRVSAFEALRHTFLAEQ
ncbi:cyclin-dependent kinase 6-like isoform X2 [Scleropages formosus]|uniref:cyclin-dependent kinase 6-like isoform X2 n=1 Tax=Scleropages formosus TaxID=113540 RepID=UPI0010FAC3A1|nr:cyclin-dependent kinase 6-like isoform X2 [Scleropages formosus]